MNVTIVDGQLFFGPKLLTALEATEYLYDEANHMRGHIEELRQLEFKNQRLLEDGVLADAPLDDLRRTLAQIRHELAEIEREQGKLFAQAREISNVEVRHIANQIREQERQAIAVLLAPFNNAIHEAQI